jgi:signal recognition particle subunit SRP72
VPSTGGAKPPTSAQPTTDPAQTKKKTRLRRVPKGITPGVTPAPDPERWIKKSERTSYQSGYGKKRRGAAGYGAGATQGVSLERETSVTGSISGGGGGGGKQSGGGGKGKKKR